MAAFVPARVLAWAVSGIALGAGMKLGSYLVSATMGDKEIKWQEIADRIGEVPDRMVDYLSKAREEPLWKRQFGNVSDD